MLGWIAVLTATVATAELLRLTVAPAALVSLSGCAKRAMRLLARRGASEANKERAMRLLALRLLNRSLQASGRLAACATPLVLLLALDRLKIVNVWASLLDWRSSLGLAAIMGLYGIARNSRAGKSGFGERLLQRLSLGTPAVSDLSFDIEVRAYGAAAKVAPDEGAPIFISGLARAGTTILTRLIYETGEFATPVYRDLPFPLAPNSWAKMSSRAQRFVPAHERGHGDGVVHDLDSPEAIEEIFWLTREAGRYRTAKGLSPLRPDDDTVRAFGSYVDLVRLRDGKARYLSKNNNNVLRLHALVDAFPDAILLHPFRDPVQQAASLLHQHVRANALAARDPFGQTFMGWLGHHEFGPGLRPFLLPDGPSQTDDPETIDYWLKLWIAVYQWLLNQAEPVRARQVFLDYDGLSRCDGSLATSLAQRLRLRQGLVVFGLRPAPIRLTRPIAPALASRARALHTRLRALSLGRQGNRAGSRLVSP